MRSPRRSPRTTTRTATRPCTRSRRTSSGWWSKRAIATGRSSVSGSRWVRSRSCSRCWQCPPGSKLQEIRRVQDASNELAQVYAELKLMGAGLQYIDVGGGLGVDYDGSGTNFPSSMNYTLNEYANDVVYRVASVCNLRDIPHPIIVSESGRAVAAYHSVL